MIKQFTFIILLLFYIHSSAQEKMTVDQQFSGLHPLTAKKAYSKYISDLNTIPNNIKLNLNSYLKIILENMDVEVNFKDGYVSNLKGYFKENPNTYDFGWIASKYQFVYRISQPKMGIKSYLIKINMDEFGQIIQCNWPRVWYKQANQFKDRSEIEKTALKRREQNSYGISRDYEIDLKYNEVQKKICWVFKFPENNSKTEYSVIEIDWESNHIISEYSTSQTIAY